MTMASDAELREMVESAELYYSVSEDIDNDPGEVFDDDPRWEVLDTAQKRLDAVLGYGFCADAKEVAESIARFRPWVPTNGGTND